MGKCTINRLVGGEVGKQSIMSGLRPYTSQESGLRTHKFNGRGLVEVYQPARLFSKQITTQRLVSSVVTIIEAVGSVRFDSICRLIEPNRIVRKAEKIDINPNRSFT